MRRLRRESLPAPVTSHLSRGERALASVRAVDGGWVVGTRDRLLLVDEAGAAEAIAWERVQRAEWDRDTASLRVETVEEYGEPVGVHVLVLPDPGTLVPLVRERVSASVVVQRRVELAKRRGFTVIGRRPPSGRGEVVWACELDAGLDPDDPAVLRATEVALASARESLGL